MYILCSLKKRSGAYYYTSVIFIFCAEMLNDCRNLGGTVLTLFSSIKQRRSDSVVSSNNLTKQSNFKNL